MNKFEYTIPNTVDNVLEDLDKNGAVLKAGGIDVLDLLKENISSAKRLVNIRNLPDFRYVSHSKENVVIGPSVTLSEIVSDENLSDYRALQQAAKVIATPQIRNVATVAGNLCQKPRCWYYRNKDFFCARKGGSMCYATYGENQYHAILENQHGCAIVHPSGLATALIAFDAKLKIVSKKGERVIDLADFFVKPLQDITRENILQQGEIISQIILPKLEKNFASFYYKQKQKQSFDWPIVEVAVSFTNNSGVVTNPKIVLGAAAPTPLRALEAENIINGQVMTKKIAEKAASVAMKNATPMTQNGYKVAIFEAVIKRTILWAAEMDPFAQGD